MTMPSIFRGNLLDDLFDDGFKSFSSSTEMMKADVKELDHGYELSMNLPGVKKEDIKAELKNGYITVSASTENSSEEKDDEGNYLRRERFYGSTSRSFYVGDQVREEDIKAKYENGVLTLTIPKKDAKQIEAEKKYIAIEG
ncbi:MAG: Hsp20/alpha crystallin family protein [Lachnospiraceae bacterium]|nr:Hsp20/alpha crystallin family protein [Lachnospiraceae bacterium]